MDVTDLNKIQESLHSISHIINKVVDDSIRPNHNAFDVRMALYGTKRFNIKSHNNGFTDNCKINIAGAYIPSRLQ